MPTASAHSPLCGCNHPASPMGGSAVAMGVGQWYAARLRPYGFRRTPSCRVPPARRPWLGWREGQSGEVRAGGGARKHQHGCGGQSTSVKSSVRAAARANRAQLCTRLPRRNATTIGARPLWRHQHAWRECWPIRYQATPPTSSESRTYGVRDSITMPTGPLMYTTTHVVQPRMRTM